MTSVCHPTSSIIMQWRHNEEGWRDLLILWCTLCRRTWHRRWQSSWRMTCPSGPCLWGLLVLSESSGGLWGRSRRWYRCRPWKHRKLLRGQTLWADKHTVTSVCTIFTTLLTHLKSDCRAVWGDFSVLNVTDVAWKHFCRPAAGNFFFFFSIISMIYMNCKKCWKMSVTDSQSPSCHLQIACAVRLTVQNNKITRPSSH